MLLVAGGKSGEQKVRRLREKIERGILAFNLGRGRCLIVFVHLNLKPRRNESEVDRNRRLDVCLSGISEISGACALFGKASSMTKDNICYMVLNTTKESCHDNAFENRANRVVCLAKRKQASQGHEMVIAFCGLLLLLKTTFPALPSCRTLLEE